MTVYMCTTSHGTHSQDANVRMRNIGMKTIGMEVVGIITKKDGGDFGKVNGSHGGRSSGLPATPYPHREAAACMSSSLHDCHLDRLALQKLKIASQKS